MAYFTRGTLISTVLVPEVPVGIAAGATLTALWNQAVADAVAYAGSYVRDLNQIDFIGDGFTQRFLLPGVNCVLLESDAHVTPVGMGTAGIAAPAATPGMSASGTGSTFLAGLHYGAFSFTTPLGETVITPYGNVLLAAGQNILFAAPTGLPAGANVQYYVSPGPLNADIQKSATGTGGAVTVSAPPGPTAGRPLVNYVPLYATLAPLKTLEQDIGLDGSASVGNATLTVTTAPTVGQRFRVVYERNPPIPASDGDVIRVPEHILRIEALKFAHRTLAYQHESGDTAAHLDAYQKLDLLSQDIQRGQTPRMRVRPRVPEAVT